MDFTVGSVAVDIVVIDLYCVTTGFLDSDLTSDR